MRRAWWTLRPLHMGKKIALYILGGLLITAGLVYALTGMLEQSIFDRSSNIARWKTEQSKTAEEAKLAIAEADKLGKEPATTGDGPSPFERKLEEIDRLTQEMKFRNELIAHEEGRKRIQTIALAIFVAAGLLALLLGWRLRPKAA